MSFQLFSKLLAVVFIYYVTGRLGLLVPYFGSQVTLFWLPTGIAVAALFHFGWMSSPAVYLGSFFVNLAVGSSATLALEIAVGNTLGPAFTVWMLKRMRFRSAFDRHQDIPILCLSAALGMLISASNGVLALWQAGVVSTQTIMSAFIPWWMGDFVGVLLATPVLLSLSPNALKEFWTKRTEFMVLVGIGLSLGWLVFNTHLPLEYTLPLSFLPLPLTVWAALRFGITGASCSTLVLSFIAVLGTSFGGGPFQGVSQHIGLLLLWAYMVTLLLTSLMITSLLVERKQFWENVLLSEAKLSRLLNHLAEGVYEIDCNGHCTFVNRAFLTLLGFKDANDVLGKNVHDLIHYRYPDGSLYPVEACKIYRAFRSNCEVSVSDEVFWRKDGTAIPVEYWSVPITQAGRIVGATVTFVDISERKRAESALRGNHQRLLYMLETSPIAVRIVKKRTHEVIFANHRYCQLINIDRDHVVGINPQRYYTHLADYEDVVSQLNNGKQVFDRTIELNIPDYGTKWVLASYLSIDYQGEPAILGWFYDITTSKLDQEALNKAKKAAAQSAFLGDQALQLAQAGHWYIDFNDGDEYYISSERTVAIFGDPLHDNLRYHIMNDWYVNIEAADKSAAEATLANYSAALEGRIPRYDMIHPYRRPSDGKVIWVHVMGQAVRDDQGKPTNMYGVVMDITESKTAELNLRIAATAFESQEGMVVTDPEGTILRVNSAFTKITGYSADEAIGKSPRILKSELQDADFYHTMWVQLTTTGGWEGEVWNKRKNGEHYPQHLTISAVKDQHGTVTHYVGALFDISSRIAAEDEIKSLAFYDPLTHLPNRRLLVDRLKHALAASTRNGKQGAILFIDLDNFKTLNDTQGHDAGDLLLEQVAQRLESCIRESDTVARFGGDEFVVILEDLSGDPFEAAAHAEMIGHKILELLNIPYALGAYEYHNSPSIGATLFGSHDVNIEELMKQADIAMYQAKSAGRNTLRFFDPQMQANINARVALEKSLRHAVETHQFVLYYQLQVTHTGRIMGAEVLIRWLHPDQGLISPMVFIPLAEETGLILPIGQWVLATACQQLKTWEDNPLTCDLQLAVNVSARQFHQADFVEQIHQEIRRADIQANRLKLELTESLVLEDINDTITKMNALREFGVHFSMDDFGTGYSSLSNLKKLPINQLKIDQSFVRDLATDRDDATIVQTIILMANTLGLEVIAEGVETEEQSDFLEQHGCFAYQGYLFSKPLPLEQFEALLLQSQGKFVIQTCHQI